jgi:hypothetical protein
MRKTIYLSLFLCFFLIPSVLFAQVLWEEDFDGYPENWSLDNDGDGRFNCPGDLYGGSFPFCAADTQGDYGSPDIEITTDANRSGGGRGFRLHIWRDSGGTCCENGITDNTLWAGQKDFYIRWYMRLNYNRQSSYAKIFRIKDSRGTQRFIFDWYRYNGKTRLILFTSEDGFGGYDYNPNWNLEDDYTPNTWVCLEAFIDQTNDEWTLWVDGVQQGDPIPFTPSDYTITGTMIGGNQVGQGSVDHVIDYDDIVVSTEYIGPVGGSPPPPDPDPDPDPDPEDPDAPSAPQDLRVVE